MKCYDVSQVPLESPGNFLRTGCLSPSTIDSPQILEYTYNGLNFVSDLLVEIFAYSKATFQSPSKFTDLFKRHLK